jgi:tyrosyl-tRNA synthetase
MLVARTSRKAAMTAYQSDLLRLLDERGYIHQITDASGLDERACTHVIPGYIGFDATAPSLHVGSMVQIMMLRRFQQAGHKPIVLMGGGTTKIGDPSFKDEARRLLDDSVIDENIASIRRVFERFLTFGDGPTDAIMLNNADWLDALDYIPFLRNIGRHFSVNRMLSFDSVKLRLDREQSLSFLEFNYMILQAYDFLGRFGPMGQYRQRHRACPPCRWRRKFRPDDAADHHG